MKKVFCVSRAFPFHLGIYPGSGPEFSEAYGWEVRGIHEISTVSCDVGIVENRLDDADVEHLEGFLSTRSGPPFPVLFKISDPEMPNSRHRAVRYMFQKRNARGVHYLSVYEPAGPVRDFFASLTSSRVIQAPYPYDARREIDRSLAGRTRRVFLSGARHRQLYPFRESVFRRFTRNPVARCTMVRLPHPGYPRIGASLRHDVLRGRFVEYAARYTHFFLDPSRYGVELMKYTECAYAGSVPIGAIPSSLRTTVARCFLQSDCRTLEVLRAVRAPMDDMMAMAREYRSAMRVARDPTRLNAALDEQLDPLVRP